MLHAAVRKKDVDIAKLLVEFGCPVDEQNVTTETALSSFHLSQKRLNYLCFFPKLNRRRDRQLSISLPTKEMRQ